MRKNWLTSYYRIGKAVGISITIGPDGQEHIALCMVKVNGEQLDFLEKKPLVSALSDLHRLLPAGVPMGLNLSGRGVLIRRVGQVNAPLAEQFAAVMPNAAATDFYIQQFGSGEQLFLAVIRRSLADHWLQLLAHMGYRPMVLSLGPFVYAQISGQLNLYGEKIIFDGHQITREPGGDWAAYRYEPTARADFSLKVENEPIEEELVLAYGSAFQLALSPATEPERVVAPQLAAKLQSALSKKKLMVQGSVFLAAVLLLLLANFLLFTSLRSANAALSERLSETEVLSTDAEQATRQVRANEDLLRVLGWRKGMTKAAMTDQLAGLLPAELTWKQLRIAPMDVQTLHQQRSIRFADNTIQVSGVSRQVLPVNEWLARIRTLPWVKHVRLQSYQFDNDLNTGQFIVTIGY